MSCFFQILKEQLIFSLFKCFWNREKKKSYPVMLIIEPNKEYRKKISISITSIDAKIASKLSVNDIQLYLIHHDQWGSYYECKNGSILGNLLIRFFILTDLNGNIFNYPHVKFDRI